VPTDHIAATRTSSTIIPTEQKEEMMGLVGDTKWMTKYNELVQYVHEKKKKKKKDGTRRGHFVVTNRDTHFGSWVKYQREAYRNHIQAMAQDRITFLEKIETWSWGMKKKPTKHNTESGGYHHNNAGSSSSRKSTTTTNDVSSRKGSNKNTGTTLKPPPPPSKPFSTIDETTTKVGTDSNVATPPIISNSICPGTEGTTRPTAGQCSGKYETVHKKPCTVCEGAAKKKFPGKRMRELRKTKKSGSS